MGRKSNFYDYGADSLIMAQITTKLRNELKLEIPFDVLLRDMLNNPTVEGIVNFINSYNEEEILDVASKKYESIAYVHEYGGEETDTLRILLHGALGNIDCYKYLAPELAKEEKGKVVGIGIQNYEKYCAIKKEELIETLADIYVELLQKYNFSKIQLVGYSFSGAVAVEMAKRFMENDIDIKDLSIIDGGAMPVTLENDLLYELLYIDNLSISLSELGFKTEDLLNKAFNNMEKRQDRELKIIDLESICEYDEDKIILKGMENKDMALRMKLYYKDKSTVNVQELFRAFKQSFDGLHFVPDVFFGDIRHFISKDKEGAYKNFHVILDEWDDMCLGTVEINEVPGDHFTCLDNKDNAMVLCEHLKFQ